MFPNALVWCLVSSWLWVQYVVPPEITGAGETGGEKSNYSSMKGLWGKVWLVLCLGSFLYKLDGSLCLPNTSSHCA